MDRSCIGEDHVFVLVPAICCCASHGDSLTYTGIRTGRQAVPQPPSPRCPCPCPCVLCLGLPLVAIPGDGGRLCCALWRRADFENAVFSGITNNPTNCTFCAYVVEVHLCDRCDRLRAYKLTKSNRPCCKRSYRETRGVERWIRALRVRILENVIANRRLLRHGFPQSALRRSKNFPDHHSAPVALTRIPQSCCMLPCLGVVAIHPS